MLSGKKVLAVVPARGGSKGIPLKNLREINGRTLVTIVGEIAAATSEIDRRVVSTDHEKIADAALAAGLDAPFRRPESIAGDRVSDWEVLVHALKTMEGLDQTTYDIVLMLQPTSPLRTVENVQGTLRMLVDGDYDSVWSVSMTDSKAHPLKQLTVVDGKMEYWDARGEAIIARQQLKAVYHRNGVAYAVTRQCLLEQKSIKGAKAGAYVVEGEHVSIDTEWDLNLVNWLLSKA